MRKLRPREPGAFARSDTVKIRTQVPIVPYFFPLSSPPFSFSFSVSLSVSPCVSLVFVSALSVPLSVFVTISYPLLCVSF